MPRTLHRIALLSGLALLALLSTETFAQVRFLDRLSDKTQTSIDGTKESFRQAIANGTFKAGHGPKLKNHGPPPDIAGLVLPHWNGSFRTDGVDYPFTVIGGDPSANQTSVIPVVIIPYRFRFADGTVIDATTDVIDGHTPLDTVLSSPILNDYPFKSGNTPLGNTQWGDAYMRGNFWSLHGGGNSGYHTRLQLVGVAPLQVIDVPAELGFSLTYGSETIGFINYEAMNEILAYEMYALGIPPTLLSVHLSGEIIEFTSVGGDALGYHWVADLSPYTGVPGFNTYIQTGIFPSDSILRTGLENVAVLSHETVEWLMDPLVSNVVPVWRDPVTPNFCWNWVMEPGDPLEQLPAMHVTFNGRDYSFPDMVFLPWFARMSSKYSVNGWFSLNNTARTYSEKCSFFPLYVTYYFPNDPGMQAAELTSMNSQKQATGYYVIGGAVTSFLLNNVDIFSPDPITLQVLSVPGSLLTIPTKINDRGQVVGIWIDGGFQEHGFLLNNGQYMSIDVPGAIATEALALNNKPVLTIAGDYEDGGGVLHGFTLTAGLFKRLDVPGAASTTVTGINNANQIVGSYQKAGENVRGFTGNPGGTTSLDYLNLTSILDTLPGGINSAGDVVGTYVQHGTFFASDDVTRGFLYGGGNFIPEDVPWGADARPTRLNDINDNDFGAGSFVPPGSGPTAAFFVPYSVLLSGGPAAGMVKMPAALSALH